MTDSQTIPDAIREAAQQAALDIEMTTNTVGEAASVIASAMHKVARSERKRCAAIAKDATMATGAPLEQMGDEVAAAVLQQPESLKFWMVYGVGTRGATFQHYSKEAAQAEAKRLAALHPDVLFVVLAAVDAYATEKPAVQRFKIVKDKPLGRDADDDIPF